VCSGRFQQPSLREPPRLAESRSINSVGNLGGFAGPFVVGWVKQTTGSFAPALLLCPDCWFLRALLLLLLPGPASAQEVKDSAVVENPKNLMLCPRKRRTRKTSSRSTQGSVGVGIEPTPVDGRASLRLCSPRDASGAKYFMASFKIEPRRTVVLG